ncbi:MAG TPA: 50S ribosomal protein L6 [Armatimonadota bacterium]|jgi:large subunit ribosomal protein L6
MSRIGKVPIALPAGVDVSQQDGSITVNGPKGSLNQPVPAVLNIAIADGSVVVTRVDDSQLARAQHGLIRTLVANMVKGVTDGYTRQLDISGVGYRAQLAGVDLQLSLGFSHPVIVKPRPGISFEVGMDTNTRSPFIKISGIDKQLVGQQAAEIRGLKKPEPYKGKGIRYQGEVIRRKAGKSGKAGGGKGKK